MKFTYVIDSRLRKNRFILILVILILFPFITNKDNFYEFLSAEDILQPINQRINNNNDHFYYSSYIDSQVENFIEYFSLKGVSIAIVKNEKLVFSKSFGYADDVKKIQATPQNIFRIASVSKLITAVAIMKLVENGKIHLNDKVFGKQGFFNEEKFLNIKDPRLYDISILNLLNHSGGWTQRYGDPMFNSILIAERVDDPLPATQETFIKFAISRNLDFTPGTSYNYSNMGYMFLGKIIEHVTGMNYEDYVQYFILYPNGIYDMHIAKNHSDDKFLNEVNYYEQMGSEKIKPYNGDSMFVSKANGGNDITLLGAAGAWVASASELAKLMVVIDGYKNVPDFLSKESIDMMTGKLGKTLGWKEIEDENWIRTGSFAGTSAMLNRRTDGIEWVFLSNTSNWKGPVFSREVNRFMSRVVKNVPEWPNQDLFNYYGSNCNFRKNPIK